MRVEVYHYDDDIINNQVIELYKNIFKVNIRPKFSWLFKNSRTFGVIATENGILVSHWAMLPLTYIIKEMKEKALIGMGMMTLDKYRGRGIALQVANKMFEFIEKSDHRFVIGFPNDNSLNLHLDNLGYKLVRNFQFIKFNNSNKSVIEKYKVVKDITVHHQTLKGIELYRDDNYLNWRYGQDVYIKYQLDVDKYVVVTIFRDKVDLLWWTSSVKPDDLRIFIDFLYKTYGVTKTCTWNTFNDFYENSIMEEREYHFCIKNISYDDEEYLLNKANWTYYMGDSDLF